MLENLPNMTDGDFLRISKFIYNGYGIKLPHSKKIMLESRLRKRLKSNNMESFEEYCEYVFSEEGKKNEVIHMIDVVSTNKTDFFREPGHFDYMTKHILPIFEEKGGGSLNVWSSACSTGEEAYSIAMTIEDFFQENLAIDYAVYCTDISSRVLQTGIKAIYDIERIKNIPLETKKKYFLKSKDEVNKTVRLVPSLRKKLRFNRLNLMDDNYVVPFEFDIIFCRNVLIYFDKPTQEKVLNKLCLKLKKGGIFFLGHSESLNGIKVPLKTIQPTIFEKI